MARQTEQWTISLPPALSKEAVQLARSESRTRSELVRQALRDYIAHQKRIIEIRRKLAANLRKQGIRTMADIERMIDEGRT